MTIIIGWTYIEGYRFLLFARSAAKNFGDKYGKKMIEAATKTGINVAKSASKRVVLKTVEAEGDLIWNKTGDKITLAGKSKKDVTDPQKYNGVNETQETYIPPGRRHQIIDDLGSWFRIDLNMYKNGIPKNHRPVRYSTKYYA